MCKSCLISVSHVTSVSRVWQVYIMCDKCKSRLVSVSHVTSVCHV